MSTITLLDGSLQVIHFLAWVSDRDFDDDICPVSKEDCRKMKSFSRRTKWFYITPRQSGLDGSGTESSNSKLPRRHESSRRLNGRDRRHPKQRIGRDKAEGMEMNRRR